MPAQLTIRANDELVERIRAAARRAGRSMNVYVVDVLNAATNPDLATDDAARLRERLAAAGLLVETPRRPRPRPSDEQTAAARRRAGRGKPLSDIVAGDR